MRLTSGSVPVSKHITRALQALACGVAVCLAGSAVWAEPKRVVSINLCADQLALLLAAPGQLVSVTRLAHDPASSSLIDKARMLPANGSGAEEIYLLKPDLVLAGTFTASATVNMLRDLGIEVELFAPARSMSDVPARLAQMGAALGREVAAQAAIDAFEDDLARLSDGPTTDRFRAALTYVNSYSSGDATLAGDILRIAGFDNAASEVGLSSVGILGLEELILLAPDIIIQGRNYPGNARAEDNLNHPALRALKDTTLVGEITDKDWICGTPQVIEAVSAMRNLRLHMEASK